MRSDQSAWLHCIRYDETGSRERDLGTFDCREEARKSPRSGSSSLSGAVGRALLTTPTESSYGTSLTDLVQWPEWAWNGQAPSPEPGVFGVVDGASDRVARLAAIGNGVVVQCAEVIGHLVQLLAEAETQ